MTPPHQISAATPQPEGLDACPSKAIHTTNNENLNAAVPVRTRTPSQSKLATLTRSTNPADIARQRALIVFQPSVHQANHHTQTHVQSARMRIHICAFTCMHPKSRTLLRPIATQAHKHIQSHLSTHMHACANRTHKHAHTLTHAFHHAAIQCVHQRGTFACTRMHHCRGSSAHTSNA